MFGYRLEYAALKNANGYRYPGIDFIIPLHVLDTTVNIIPLVDFTLVTRKKHHLTSDNTPYQVQHRFRIFICINCSL
jgi:hypothetical protein